MKKKAGLFIFLICICFVSSMKVLSLARPDLPEGDYIVQVGSNGDGYTMMYRQNNSKRVFCLLKGAQAPAYGSNQDWTYRTCSSSHIMSDKLKAAIGYSINECDNTDASYIKTQRVIHKLLSTYNSGQSVSSYDEILYNSAVSVYNKYGSESLSISALSFSSSGNNWVSTSTITKSNIDSVTVNSLKKGSTALSTSYASISGNTLTITIPKSEISSTSTITVELKGTTSYNMAIVRSCGSGIQPIAEYDTEEKTNTETATSSGTITIEYYLDLNGYLDGTNSGNISGYGTADVYINGSRVADDVTDYYTKWPTGTTYEIKDIKTKSGKQYNGVKEGSLKGTINADKSVRLNFSSLGGLTITKTNSSNDKLKDFLGETTFKLYTNSQCTGTNFTDNVDSAGIASFPDLSPGTYYLKESSAKKGYHTPEKGESWYCDAVTITAGETKNITIYNKTECEFAFEKGEYKPKNEDVSYSLDTMLGRIKLYNDIKLNYDGLEFNALLDMSKTTAVDACTNIPITKNYNKGCLTSNSNSTNSSNFSNTNVSMYTEKYGSYTFCLTKYNLVNSLGQTRFNNIKSGQPIIRTDNTVATATLNRVCYNFGDANITDTKYNNFNYSNYVKKVSIDGETLIKSESSSGTINNKTITATYTLPLMQASNKDGRIYYGSCPRGEFCKPLGRGIISNFNERPNTEPYNLRFDIEYEGGQFGSLTGTFNDCKYTIVNELIDYKSKLHVEFRHVNTDSDALFLGKNGTDDRHIGSNWQSEEDRNYVLKIKNNSFNKNKEEALYKITLTSDLIKEIRENNKSKTYDDYNMTCLDNGTICISNYLTCLQQRRLLTIKDRKNIDLFVDDQVNCVY